MGNRICSIADCDKPSRGRKVCSMHAKRLARGADLSTPSIHDPWDVRFWRSIDTSGDCWIWTGRRFNDGYGTINIHGVPFLAHRVAYAIRHGDLPEGAHICHHCDTPPCVNPDHLYAGTPATNAADKMRRGRNNPLRGEAHPFARLSMDKARTIRTDYAAGVSRRQLADRYDVSRSTIDRTINGVRWV